MLKFQVVELSTDSSQTQLDPRRFLQILHLPIRAIRLLTDPVVDTVVYVITEIIFPQYLMVGRGLFDLILLGVLLFAKAIFGRDRVEQTNKTAVAFVSRIAKYYWFLILTLVFSIIALSMPPTPFSHGYSRRPTLPLRIQCLSSSFSIN